MATSSPDRISEALSRLNIRPRDEADDPRIVAIRNDARPWLPPISVTEYRWQADPANSSPGDFTERWVAEMDGEVLGLYLLSKMSWIERKNTFAGNIGIDHGHRGRGVGSALFNHLMDRATAEGATRLYGQVSAEEEAAATFLEHRGFAKTGRAARMSRLVIAEANLEGYEGVVDRLREGGIEIRTREEVGPDNEPAMRAIHALNTRAGQDIPSSEAFTGPPFEDFMRWLNSPGNSPDQCWIAYDHDRPVGYASVSRRGDDSSFNNFTAVDRDYRGRGIARAVKLKTVEWAQANGIKIMFTANDYENKPMLSINIPLGYVEVPADLEVMRDL